MTHQRFASLPTVLLLFVPLVTHAADDNDLIDADRPGIADGASTVKRGHFQIETGFAREDRSDAQALNFPLLLRYGFTDRFEARIESDTFQRQKTGGRTLTGWNPISLGFKYHVIDQKETSVSVIAGWVPPSGSGEFRSDRSSGDVRLAVDLELGEHWLINPNLGVQRDESSAMSGTGALTLQYNITKKANVFIDGGVQRSEVLLDAGAAWILGTDTQIDASVGRGTHGSNAPKFFWSAGVSRRF
jgi:hypothetical protein